MTDDSRLGKELFVPGSVKAVDPPHAHQATIGLDGVNALAGSLTRRGDDGPVGHKLGAGLDPRAPQNGTCDDPLDVEDVVAGGGGDDHGSGILNARGISSVDGVGPSKARTVVPANGEVAREGAGIEHDQKRHNPNDPSGPLHSRNPIVDIDERLVIPGWIKVSGFAFGLFLVAALAFAIFEPIQVLPRIRLAPGYALTAQDGSVVTSETARGTLTLYTFAPTDCGASCAAINATRKDVRDRVPTEVDLGETDFRLITIALDPVTQADELVQAGQDSGADGDVWQWVGGSEAEIRTVVGSGFQRFYEPGIGGSIRFDPGYVLVDGAGVVRGEYRYQTLAADSDKIVSHIGVLGQEIRNANGATAVAYEAAHLFLCYP